MTTQPKLLTADDLLRLHSQGIRGELVRGVFYETMPSGREHGTIAAKLSFLLGSSVWPRKLGELTTSDSGVWLERNPDTVREPDIAYFSAAKSQPGVRVTGYSEDLPDLVVEIVSPNDTQREVSEKASMWLGFGVRLVWVVQPDTRAVDVYVEGDDKTTIADSDFLDGGDVLPGFRCLVRDIFDS